MSYVFSEIDSSLTYMKPSRVPKAISTHAQRIKNRLHLHTLRLNYIKRKQGCNHCGIWDYTVLEFNHLPSFKKDFNIGKTKGKSKSWATIANEVKKCEVLCANCHKRVTARKHGRAGYGVRVCDSGVNPEPSK